jgi:hypothetical protein
MPAHRRVSRYLQVWKKQPDGSWLELWALPGQAPAAIGTSLALRPLQERTTRTGDLDVTFGTYEMVGGMPEGRPVTRGRYVTIRARDRYGSWKTHVALTGPPDELAAPR